MDPSEAAETGNILFGWLNDYGALQCWAMWGMVCTIGGPILFVWAVWKLARPISRLADFVDEMKKEARA